MILTVEGPTRCDEPARGGPDPADVAAAVAGDRDAVTRLLRAIRPAVVRYSRARLGRRVEPGQSWHSPEDVAQDVCLAVFVALPRYKERGRPFMAFVHGIASNVVNDAFRRRARSPAIDRSALDPDEHDHQVPPDASADPETVALHNGMADGLRSVLAVLPARARDIVVLRVALGYSAEEVAALHGMTPGSVRLAQHRAMARLRQALGPTIPSQTW